MILQQLNLHSLHREHEKWWNLISWILPGNQETFFDSDFSKYNDLKRNVAQKAIEDALKNLDNTSKDFFRDSIEKKLFELTANKADYQGICSHYEDLE